MNIFNRDEQLSLEMSMINEPVDYNNTLLTWKLPPKKCFDLKNGNSVDILVAAAHQNNVEAQGNIHADGLISKQFTHYATLHEHHIPNQTGMIISHIPSHLNGDIPIQHLKPNENIHIQQVIPISTQNVIHIQNNQPTIKNDPPKEKTGVKKKIKRIPVDGIAYHSKQLGLKVPPKKV